MFEGPHKLDVFSVPFLSLSMCVFGCSPSLTRLSSIATQDLTEQVPTTRDPSCLHRLDTIRKIFEVAQCGQRFEMLIDVNDPNTFAFGSLTWKEYITLSLVTHTTEKELNPQEVWRLEENGESIFIEVHAAAVEALNQHEWFRFDINGKLVDSSRDLRFTPTWIPTFVFEPVEPFKDLPFHCLREANDRADNILRWMLDYATSESLSANKPMQPTR